MRPTETGLPTKNAKLHDTRLDGFEICKRADIGEVYMYMYTVILGNKG
jgi:hypothetical protein